MTTARNTIAFIAKTGATYACVLDGKQIAKSKHQDYFKYHYGRHDVKALERDITQFVYLDETGKITRVTDPTGSNEPDAVMRRHATQAAAIAAH